MTSIVFFGTQEFAGTVLSGLLANSHFRILAVVTQPDRPVGRKQILTPPPVKILALKHNLPIFQPESLKDFNLKKVVGTVPDLNVVAQYGLMIPESIILAPKYETINVHTSLLPKYRGASPIQSALINGETETGVTIMLMDKGMDTGPILAQQEIAIDPDDTYESLDKTMAIIGRDLLLQTIPKYISGETKPKVQDDSKASICKKLDRDSGHIDWTHSAAEIYNLYRGLYPWPGIWTTWNNLRVKLLKIKPIEFALAPGHIKTEQKKLFVGSGKGVVEILELQVEGKTVQTAESFIAGYAPNNQNFV